MRPRTAAVDGGLSVDPSTGAIAPNISTSVNNAMHPGDGAFSADGVDDLAALPYLYARWTNPTVRQLEQRVAALENADDALATASGVAAAAAVFFTFLKAGDHLIVSDVCYAGVHELARNILPDYGIEVSAVDLSNLEDVAAAVRPNTRLIHAETPCNPILRLSDIAGLAALAHAAGALLSVDSTMATPVITRPLDLGADLVLHSLTKFMNGHGDALGGIVAGRTELIARMRSRAGVYLGATLGAQAAWSIMRGIETLHARMHMATANAGEVARFLEAHPKVKAVTYPGLASHPQQELIARQMALPGAMLTFQTHDPERLAARMAETLKVFHYAYSLGHTRSIVVFLKTDDIMASTFRADATRLSRYRQFAGDGVFRTSIGLEDPADLMEDLDAVFNA